MSEEKQIISYHTFIFPFLFDTSGKLGRERFLKYLPEQGKALCQDDVKWNNVPNKALFDQYRYFTQAAKNTIYTMNFDAEAIVWNYRYDLEYMFTGKTKGEWLKSIKGSNNPAVFRIKQNSLRATLAINGVRLKLFNTGIGLLAFELENYELSREEDITAINEFGRRVFMPFIDKDTVRSCHLCAENISLLYDGKLIKAASGNVHCMDTNKADRIVLAPFIQYFLSNSHKKAVASPRPQKNEWFIEPIIDDRMFVACLYRNTHLANQMAQWNTQEKTYAFLNDAERLAPSDKSNLARRLYEIVFVDGDGMSCHSRNMLREQLEKHIYPRWLEYGTVTGITEYSMVTVTTNVGMEYLVTPFLAEYIEMLYLVLAQRATFLAFERTISNVACSGYKHSINAVQRKYVLFQSQLLPQSVTNQQQGIELYDMIQECLLIGKQAAVVDGQIRALYELETVSNEKWENWILFLLATLGVVDCVSILCGDWFNMLEVCQLHLALAIILLLFLVNFQGKKLLYLIRKIFSRKK